MRTKVWAWSLALVASVHVTSASADEGPAGGEQVASRFPVGNPTTETLDAVDGLRTRLGALDGLPLEFRTQSAAELPGVVEAAYGPEGNVIGLWAYREGASVRRCRGKTTTPPFVVSFRKMKGSGT